MADISTTTAKDSERCMEETAQIPRTGNQGEIDFGDAIYQQKAEVLNLAIRDIGMGRYQWELFCLTGFGHFCSNIGFVVSNVIIPPTVNEFSYKGPLIKLGESIGSVAGAILCGLVADLWGRRITFHITLLWMAIFILVAGASPDWITLTSFASIWSVGASGNLPINSMILLEFVPATHQYLLTVLSMWWAFAQLFASLVGWLLIGRYSCAIGSPCVKSSNMGWRYFLFTLGGFMITVWVVFFFMFKLFESPKYLMGRGKDREGLEVIRKVAKRNGKETTLTLADLNCNARRDDDKESFWEVVKQSFGIFDRKFLQLLFATRKLAWSTSLLIMLWTLIGLAYPLYNAYIPYYLASRGATFGDGSINKTYRNLTILSLPGIPGAMLAGYLVELPVLGRRGTLSISTILTGVTILGTSTARHSNALLGWNCVYTFTSNVMWGVLFTITAELFPTKARGTGSAIVFTACRIAGIISPIVALYADLTTSAPIYIAGATFLISGIVAIFLPYESRGRASV